MIENGGTGFRMSVRGNGSISMRANEWRRPADLEPLDVAVPIAKDRLQRIKDAFAVADGLKIIFVGETIIDEYRYVRALQKSAKEYVIATVETGKDEFAGGIVAATKHAEWLHAEYLSSWKTLRKTRFVDADFKRKLFEVYSVDRIELSEEERRAFRRNLSTEVASADVVIVLDFGHGLIGADERHILTGATFLAVNAQTNAGNYGFNPVTKYTQADFVCVDEPEARLAAIAYNEPLADVANGLFGRMTCERYLITRGRSGLAGYDMTSTRKSSHFNLPAFAAGGIDTIGAGDAVMAVTAPLLAAGLSLEDAAFVGNVAGAIKVGIIGHQRHVGRAELMQAIEARLA